MTNGFTPKELLQAVGFDDDPEDDLAKFNTDQQRVPAGSRRESGRWTSGDPGSETGSSTVASAVAALAPRGAPLLAPTLGAETLAALSALAASVGFAATLGVLLVPSPNTTSSSGPLPGDTENSYSYSHDEGLLRILGPAGNVLAAGHKDGSGVFYDADTGVPFARELDGALLFDDATLPLSRDDAAAVPQTDTDDDEPKLCPAPGPDQPGAMSASARAKAYQEQISFMINPQRPLAFGLAMNLVNPLTAKLVHYDECDEQTGTMIEAKGPGFNGLLSFPAGQESVTRQWLDQGERELQAAGTRNGIWYFAEERAAAYAQSLFWEYGLGKIIVKVQPAV